MEKSEKKDHSNKEEKGGENLINLTIIVNGSSTEVKTNINSPLKVAVEKALEQTGNTGRPIEDWKIKRENGEVLDMDKKVKELNLSDSDELFLSLEAGVGGMK